MQGGLSQTKNRLQLRDFVANSSQITRITIQSSVFLDRRTLPENRESEQRSVIHGKTPTLSGNDKGDVEGDTEEVVSDKKSLSAV